MALTFDLECHGNTLSLMVDLWINAQCTYQDQHPTTNTMGHWQYKCILHYIVTLTFENESDQIVFLVVEFVGVNMNINALHPILCQMWQFSL